MFSEEQWNNLIIFIEESERKGEKINIILNTLYDGEFYLFDVQHAVLSDDYMFVSFWGQDTVVRSFETNEITSLDLKFSKKEKALCDDKIFELTDYKIKNILRRDIKKDYGLLLEKNPDLYDEALKIQSRICTNYFKTLLGLFNLEYYEMIVHILKDKPEDEDLIDLIKSLTEYMNYFYDSLNVNLKLNDLEDFEQMQYIISVCMLLLEEAIAEDDIELAYHSFTQLKSRLSKVFKDKGGDVL